MIYDKPIKITNNKKIKKLMTEKQKMIESNCWEEFLQQTHTPQYKLFKELKLDEIADHLFNVIYKMRPLFNNLIISKSQEKKQKWIGEIFMKFNGVGRFF